MDLCTLQQLRDRVAKFEYLGRREDDELQDVLDRAYSRISLKCPQVATGGISGRLADIATKLHNDMALNFLQQEIERDDRGGVPDYVMQKARMLADELKDLAHAAQVEGSAAPGQRGAGGFQVDGFCPLPRVPYPGHAINDGVLGGSASQSDPRWMER